MRGRDSYGEFAYAYDQALGNKFFAAISPVLDELLRKYPATQKTHLDLACGTGLAMQYFAGKGFRSIGVDGSMAMLRVARKRADLLFVGDIRYVGLTAHFSRVTCLYDSLNHLLRPYDLAAAFESARAVMGRESLFFFDVNHPDAYPDTWGLREPYVSSGPDHQLVLDTTYSGLTRKGKARLDGWAIVDGRRVEISETHRQRAYSQREIETALRDAKLETVEIVRFDPFAPEDHDRPVKLLFVVKAI